MGIHYESLDDPTRRYMLEEVALGGHYISPRLTQSGQAAWLTLLEGAARHHSDTWLAQQLMVHEYVRTEEEYTRGGITRSRRINQPHAAQQLAEGEFNRYYIRGLCVRAKAEGKTHC